MLKNREFKKNSLVFACFVAWVDWCNLYERMKNNFNLLIEWFYKVLVDTEVWESDQLSWRAWLTVLSMRGRVDDHRSRVGVEWWILTTVPCLGPSVHSLRWRHITRSSGSFQSRLSARVDSNKLITIVKQCSCLYLDNLTIFLRTVLKIFLFQWFYFRLFY